MRNHTESLRAHLAIAADGYIDGTIETHTHQPCAALDGIVAVCRSKTNQFLALWIARLLRRIHQFRLKRFHRS